VPKVFHVAIEARQHHLSLAFAIMRSFRFPGISNYRALITTDGDDRSRDPSMDTSLRGDDKEASTRYLLVLTCSTGG
jgi:hypothetical protein